MSCNCTSNGGQKAPVKLREYRLSKCQACPALTTTKIGKKQKGAICGCPIPDKVSVREELCPAKQWQGEIMQAKSVLFRFKEKLKSMDYSIWFVVILVTLFGYQSYKIGSHIGFKKGMQAGTEAVKCDGESHESQPYSLR